jgi:hypothetical protein
MNENTLVTLMPFFIILVMFFSFMSIFIVHQKKKADRIKRLNSDVQRMLDGKYSAYDNTYRLSNYDNDSNIIDMTKPSKDDIVDNVVSIGLYRDKIRNVYNPRKRSDWDK